MKKTDDIPYLRTKYRSYVQTASIHGGVGSRGKRKTRRILSLRRPQHLVFQTVDLSAQYHLSAKPHKARVARILRCQANRFAVRISAVEIRQQELHVICRMASRDRFQNFLRSVSAMIARKVSGARKGRKFGRFWSHLVYSAVLLGNLRGRFFFAAIKSCRFSELFAGPGRDLVEGLGNFDRFSSA